VERYLLDTMVLVDLILDRRGRRELMRQLVESGAELSHCTISVIEVYSGMRPEESEITETCLQPLTYLHVTQSIAIRAGLLRYEWARRGHTLSLADVTIAAVALHHGLTLITDNRKHFPMRELSLFPLPRPA
jgi:predicted nucleic acid-binding protein